MKSYKEMADIVFQRRDEYMQKRKARNRAIAVCITSALFGCVVLLVSFALWQNGKNGMDVPMDTPSATQNGETDTTTFHGNNPSTTPPTSQPSTDHSNDAPSTSEPSTPSTGTTDPPPISEPSSPSSGTTDPPPAENDYHIDSIDKINFYSAKKIIRETSLLPFRMNMMCSASSNVRFLNDIYAEYPLDRDRVFTVTMVTYFTIELDNENGFLAQKLGGTGPVEVVVTQNDLDELGQIITFKRENNYYSCLINGEDHDLDSNRMSRHFSSHKYIEGFSVVKNYEQENYTFTVHYDGAQVIGFECTPQNSASPAEKTDAVTFVEDFCVVLFTKQYITIDQLEQFFIRENREDIL